MKDVTEAGGLAGGYVVPYEVPERKGRCEVSDSKRKPDIKVLFKSKGGEKTEYVDFAAFWRNDTGMYGGGLDKRITRVKIEFTDGSTKLIDVRDPKNPSHYCNVFAGAPQAATTTKRAEQDDTDDIPFD